jgi:hypothetical protein
MFTRTDDDSPRSRRLGEILELDADRLATALEHAQARGQRLGSVLIKLGYAPSDRVALALGEQHGIDAALEGDLAGARSERHLLGAIQAWRLLAIPLRRERSGVLIVAVADPGNPGLLDEIITCVGPRVRLVVATESSLRVHLERLYGPPSTRRVPAAAIARPKASGTAPGLRPDGASLAPATYAAPPHVAPRPAPRASALVEAPPAPAPPPALLVATGAAPPSSVWHFSLRWRIAVIGAIFVPAVLFLYTMASRIFDDADSTPVAAGRYRAGSGLSLELPEGWIEVPDSDVESEDPSGGALRGTWLQRGGTAREPQLGLLLLRWRNAGRYSASFDVETLIGWVDSMGARIAAARTAGGIEVSHFECELTDGRQQSLGYCTGQGRRYGGFEVIAWVWSVGTDDIVATFFFSRDSAFYVEEESAKLMQSVELR